VWTQALKTEEFARACGGLMLALNVPTPGMAPLLLCEDPDILRRFVWPAFQEISSGRAAPVLPGCQRA
jgi:hypothetical protein